MKKREHTKIHFPLFMFVPPLDESRLEEIDGDLLQPAKIPFDFIIYLLSYIPPFVNPRSALVLS